MQIFLALIIITNSNSKIEEAKKLFESGKIKESIALYKEGIKRLSGYKKIEETLNLVDLLIRSKNYKEALNYLLDVEEQVSRFSMLYPEILYRKALIHENLGDFSTAQKLYEKILTEYPKSKVFDYANYRTDKLFEILSKDYIATVGPISITYSEFENFIKDMPPIAKPSPSDTQAIKRILDNLIMWKLLYLEALKNKLDLSPEFIEREKRSKERNLARYFMEVTNKKFKVSEDELKEYYAKHRNEFKIPYKWDIRKIEVKTKLDAIEILKKLKEGKSFESLAKKYSIGKEAAIGGLIKNLSETSKMQELVKVLKSMKEGDIRGPIKLQNGNYAIIKLLKTYPGRYKTYDEVKKLIETKLLNIKRAQFWEKWKNEKLKEYEIKYYLKGKKIETGKEGTGLPLEK